MEEQSMNIISILSNYKPSERNQIIMEVTAYYLKLQEIAIKEEKTTGEIEYTQVGEKSNGDTLECVRRKIGGMSKEELVKLLEIVEGVVRK